MERFLKMYQEARSPTLLAGDFRRVAGTEVVDALLDATVLTRCELADWYPCDGGHLGCPRRVVPNFGDASRPLVAVCGQPFPACHEIHIRPEDLEEYTTSHESFARALRSLLGLSGEFTLLDDSYPDCVYLGDMRRDELTYDVFLCRAAWDSAFEELLADRQLALRRSVVLAPSQRGIPLELVHRYPPGSHVTLAFLVDLVAADSRGLLLQPTFEALTKHRGVAQQGAYLAITNDGRHTIGTTEYQSLVARTQEFDLFLDGSAAGHSRKYAASYRDRRGTFQQVSLSSLQMRALTELVSRGVPVRAADLRTLQAAAVQNPGRVVESGRRTVDVRLSRYEWRSFHTLGAEASEQKQYLFRPPSSLRYACILAASANATGVTS